MSLNLGLESLGITATDDVSFESVLTAQLAVQDARSSFEHAMFDLATTARNVENFNEIVKSLKQHSSVECAAFATDLLGVPSAEAAEAAVPEAKVAAADKAAGNWIDKIKEWIKKCYQWVKAQLRKLTNALHLTSDLTRNPKVKVHWSLAEVEAFKSQVAAGKMGKLDEKNVRGLLKMGLLSEKPKGAVLDLSEELEAQKYLNRLGEMQNFLYQISSLIRKTTSADTTGMQLTTQTALLKRIGNVQKYVLADTKAIMDASAASAGKINKKFGEVKKQNQKLQQKIEDNKKVADEK